MLYEFLWYTRPVNWLDEAAKKFDEQMQIYCVREHALNAMLLCEHLNLVSLELCCVKGTKSHSEFPSCYCLNSKNYSWRLTVPKTNFYPWKHKPFPFPYHESSRWHFSEGITYTLFVSPNNFPPKWFVGCPLIWATKNAISYIELLSWVSYFWHMCNLQ